MYERLSKTDHLKEEDGCHKIQQEQGQESFKPVLCEHSRKMMSSEGKWKGVETPTKNTITKQNEQLEKRIALEKNPLPSPSKFYRGIEARALILPRAIFKYKERSYAQKTVYGLMLSL